MSSRTWIAPRRLGQIHLHLRTISYRPLQLSMEKLEVLPAVSRLSEHVVRVLGQNPGKFTLQGTNTYIIGSQNPYTLIDTGEGREEYISVLESALRETAKAINANEPDISDIVISHWHGDHVGGIPSVLSLLRKLWEERNPSVPFTPPRLHKYPYETTEAVKAHQAKYSLPSIISSLPPNSYKPTTKGGTFHDLADGQTLTPHGLRVIYAPGHTADSLCLYIPQDKALYSADTVLGQGTAVFEDLTLYMQSLENLLHFGDQVDQNYTSIYPGHGPVVQDGKALISQYIGHRLERETQILKLLGTTAPPSPAGESSPHAMHWTTWKIVSTLYAAYPESLWLPAAHNVHLHLRKLEDDGRVRPLGGEKEHMGWELVDMLRQAPPVDRSG